MLGVVNFLTHINYISEFRNSQAYFSVFGDKYLKSEKRKA